MPIAPGTLEMRVWERINVTKTCWLWTGYINDKGYGEYCIYTAWGMRKIRAHRLVYNLTGHGIPDGLTLDHLKQYCGNRHCVNPSHLEPVSRGENSRRGFSTNKAKTHCPRGHEYTRENTRFVARLGTQPSRVCRACKKLRPSFLAEQERCRQNARG